MYNIGQVIGLIIMSVGFTALLFVTDSIKPAKVVVPKDVTIIPESIEQLEYLIEHGYDCQRMVSEYHCEPPQ